MTEEARLLVILNDCFELSHAAWSALKHPVHSVVYDGGPYRLLVEADRSARAEYRAARDAVCRYRNDRN
jgi:hypothetical protein